MHDHTSTRRRSRTARAATALLAAVAAATLLGTGTAAARPADDYAILHATVVGPSGEPVPHVFVNDDREFFAGQTDAHGVLVAPIRTVVDVVCANPGQDTTQGGPTGLLAKCVDVTLVAAKTTTVRIVLGLAGAFGGRVTDARTGGRVAGAAVTQEVPGGEFPTVTTDATGAYRFRSQYPTAYDLSTLAVSARSSSTAPWGYVGRYPAGTGLITLQAGVLTKGVDVSLVPYVRVTGAVTDDTGKRVPNAYVTIRVSPSQSATTTTNSAGNYLLVVPWNSTGAVCAKVDPGGAYSHGLAKQCQNGLFRKGTEVDADFALRPVS